MKTNKRETFNSNKHIRRMVVRLGMNPGGLLLVGWSAAIVFYDLMEQDVLIGVLNGMN